MPSKPRRRQSIMLNESALMPPPPPRLPIAGGGGEGDVKKARRQHREQQQPSTTGEQIETSKQQQQQKEEKGALDPCLPLPPFAGKRRKREQLQKDEEEQQLQQQQQQQQQQEQQRGEDSCCSSSSSGGVVLSPMSLGSEGRLLLSTASNIDDANSSSNGIGSNANIAAMGVPVGQQQQQQSKMMKMAIETTTTCTTNALHYYNQHQHQHQQHQQHQQAGAENVPPPSTLDGGSGMAAVPMATMYEGDGNCNGNGCDNVQNQQHPQYSNGTDNTTTCIGNPPTLPNSGYAEAVTFIAQQQPHQQYQNQSGGQDDDENSSSSCHPEIPSTTFADIIGHGQAKLRLDEALLPLALPPDLTDSVLTGVRAAPASILLHGPPGCGKSKLAQAVAGESSSPLITVGPSDVLSKFVGESERSIRQLFDVARLEASRSDSRCCVLFFDEIDSIGGARSGMGGSFGDNGGAGGAMTASVGGGGDGGSGRRVLAELLIQLTRNFNEVGDDEDDYEGCGDDGEDATSVSSATKVDACTSGADAGVSSASTRAISPVPPRSGGSSNEANTNNGATSEQQQQQQQKRRQRKPKIRIIVVAATNRPEDCDPALLRRFAVRVFVGPPTRRDRKKILSKFLSDVEHRITPSQLEEIAAATEGWSGSELESLSREAVMAPVRECLRSAALLRAKARKREQQSGTDSGQDSRKPATNHFEIARDALIGSFRTLRPVALEDFQAAMHFCLSGEEVGLVHTQDGPFSFQKTSGGHYDSESSSDEEGI